MKPHLKPIWKPLLKAINRLMWAIAVITGALLLLSAKPALAHESVAEQTQTPSTPNPPMTVLAMIKAETQVLENLQAEKNKVSARARPAPLLLSIYGVLPQLRAVVLIEGREVVFEQGRQDPLYPAASSVRLRRIKPPCVSFAQNAQVRTVCLPKVGS